MLNFPPEMLHPLGVRMALDETRVLLVTNGALVEELLGTFEEFGLRPEGFDDETQPAVAINHGPDRVWLRTPDSQPIDDGRLAAIREQLGDRLGWFGPVYQFPNIDGPGGRVCALPNALLIRFNERAERPTQALRSIRESVREQPERSELLTPHRYFRVLTPEALSAYDVQRQLLDDERVREVKLEHMPMVVPTCTVPNDPNFGQQWGMTRVLAGGPGTTAWDITTGLPSVVVAVLDSGCDLTHPDLTYASAGRNLGNPGGDGSPTGAANIVGHGTACAGIATAQLDNGVGVAGMAGGCRLLPLAFNTWSDAEVTAGINAAAIDGARVLSMSFGVYHPSDGMAPAGWDFGIIDPAIANAVNNRDMVVCAATGNENFAGVNRYPARHPLVMAIGASDQVDDRKSPTSPDNETWWGSNWGPGVSVVAPGVLIPTTDIQGAAGYDNGSYTMRFNGTSSATPHVAGLAALIASRFPTLDSAAIRRLIERTADKVGPTPYADVPGFPNGRRNQAMGYGRINALQALGEADIMIRDYPGDAGAEPSSPPGGNFWDLSDVVVRINDDDVFDPADPGRSRNVERGQTNYLYVRVTNRGPVAARNVVVDSRITPYVGLQFVYPNDWNAVDPLHSQPQAITNFFPSIDPGTSAIAKFTISAAQTEELWGWERLNPWHPCVLVRAVADNDYAFANATFAGSPISMLRNNLAQRNLTVIDVLAGATAAAWPFVAGNPADGSDLVTLRVDRRRLPHGAEVLVALDDDGRAFPRLQFDRPDTRGDGWCDRDQRLVFLDRTRIQTRFGCDSGILTLESGSSFECSETAALPSEIAGGELVVRRGRTYFRVDEAVGTLKVPKQPNSLVPLSATVRFPNDLTDRLYELRVSQADPDGTIRGGATVAYMLGGEG